MDNNNYKHILPKNKYDFESIEKMKGLKQDELLHLAPLLIGWMSDYAWPIAKDVAKLLLSLGAELIPTIKEILAPEKDYDLKGEVLSEIVKKLDFNIVIEILPELKRLRDKPTDQERNENIDYIASMIINDMDNK